MKNVKYLLLTLMAVTLLISACKKDDNADKAKPFIEVLGYDPVYTALGLPYIDAGALAWDVTATGDTVDITSRLVTQNNVDTQVAGTYEVTYNVTDEAGNAADERKRQVKVVIGK
ncbi:MAG: hypothetical protein DRI88_07800 [Bacteroidetes bacterium]|nr:MAG: hypothetical protein DRI88_07800 [Bacteroidota bacterium]RLD87663.1 MAG: hypothetical protein DRJ02_05800 [Bacteroidota bacterium]